MKKKSCIRYISLVIICDPTGSLRPPWEVKSERFTPAVIRKKKLFFSLRPRVISFQVFSICTFLYTFFSPLRWVNYARPWAWARNYPEAGRMPFYVLITRGRIGPRYLSPRGAGL